jgi:hypothetical protein
VRIGSKQAERLTKTEHANEYQPVSTYDGQLVIISDKNGIPNVYKYNLNDRTMVPLTNLQSGVMQMSVSADGSRLAVNALNKGNLDIYLVKNPFARAKEGELEPNHWAERRMRESEYERVPATLYALDMYGNKLDLKQADVLDVVNSGAITGMQSLAVTATDTPVARKDQDLTTNPDTLQAADTTEVEPQKTDQDTTKEQADKIDYRNYVFGDTPENDSLVQEAEAEEFDREEHMTEEGHFIPQQYRLKFSPDITYASSNLSTQYGAFGMTQLVYSDLLGNHQIMFGSNLVFDLRNSDYMLQYGYTKQRTNYFTSFFHTSRRYQTVYGELLRLRTYGGGISMQYPFNKFERIDFGADVVAIAKDLSVLGLDETDNQNTTFFYPQVTYTSDHTQPGFLTPQKGSRYSVSLTASPPISDKVVFGSILGDWRQYFDLGGRYSFAMRSSGAASLGPDGQTYFMGGMMGWINQRWARNSLPTDQLEDLFFTMPALPMRGYSYNTLYGDRFGLVNLEFRFPLFAAVLPGPLPILPLYNIQGVAFLDAGAAWGMDIEHNVSVGNQFQSREVTYYTNDAEFNPKISRERTVYLDPNDPSITYDDPSEAPVGAEAASIREGDILIGAGFGLRTILLGLPFRWDVGWPYTRDGFQGSPIHYFTIGIDF